MINQNPEIIRKVDPREQLLKMNVRLLYDLQRLRIAAANRNTKGIDGVHLADDDREFLGTIGDGLDSLEKHAEKQVKKALKGIPIYEHWLSKQKGCGTRMSGFLISETNIERCETPSQLWAWFGLAVVDGHAERRHKGQKARFDPERKAKVLKVLGESLIKKLSDPWYDIYIGYKHRKETQNVPECMGCKGQGKRSAIKIGARWKDTTECTPEEIQQHGPPKETSCWNCEGTGGPAPWGRSQQHRHQAAIRYMIKQFLLVLWREWRTLAGLPVRPPYHVEKLGMPEHRTIERAPRKEKTQAAAEV